MNTVKKILEETRFTYTHPDGAEFVLRRLSHQLALEALGSKSFGLLKGQELAESGEGDETTLENLKIVKDYLSAAMISPRLADETDPEQDQISFNDLGHYVTPIFNAFFESGGPEGINFTRSSPEPTE